MLALLSFFAGTSLACFQKGVGTVHLAEDCCKGHCQHAMVGDMAAQCCQSHQTRVAQVLPVTSPAKIVSLVAYTLPVALILPVNLQGPARSWVRPTGERPSPFPPLYALYCTLLI
jgi:hypothetical protein